MFANFRFKRIGLQPEIIFSTQGFFTDLVVTTGSSQTIYQTRWNFSYVNIPVIVKVYPSKKFYFEAGPQLGFLVAAHGDFPENPSGSQTNRIRVNIKEDFKSTDMGASLGLGYDFSFGLSVGGRFNLGLTEIYEEGFPPVEMKNRVFQLSVGYSLLSFARK